MTGIAGEFVLAARGGAAEDMAAAYVLTELRKRPETSPSTHGRR